MSRTHKKASWLHNDNQWRGIKQNIRDNERPKIKNRDAYKKHRRVDNHDCIPSITCNSLFSQGKSIETIRSRLKQRFRLSTRIINEILYDQIPNHFYIIIDHLVCVERNRVISPSTFNAEPYFAIYIDLPLYQWTEIMKLPFYQSWQSWAGGMVILINNKLYKYSKNKMIDDNKKYSGHLVLWPNERITTIVIDIVGRHIDSGMHDTKFIVGSWKDIGYRLEIENV